jgi:hypothetical protein
MNRTAINLAVDLAVQRARTQVQVAEERKRRRVTLALLVSLLGGARHQVRRFFWLFGRVWTEPVLLPLKAVCRSSAR